MFAIIQIPQHGDSIFPARSGEGPVGRHSEGVEVSSVTVVIGLELTFGELPDLCNNMADR